MIRVVVDTGVFVSALIGARGSAPDLVVRAMIDDRVEVIACPQLFDELLRTATWRTSSSEISRVLMAVPV